MTFDEITLESLATAKATKFFKYRSVLRQGQYKSLIHRHNDEKGEQYTKVQVQFSNDIGLIEGKKGWRFEDNHSAYEVELDGFKFYAHFSDGYLSISDQIIERGW